MKIAILGSTDPAQRAAQGFEQWGAQVLSFCPQAQHFWVQKRALSLDEEIPGHTRFYDPFRVVYEQQYSEQFLQQLKTQEGAIPGFSEEDMAHLLRPVENFVDVDIVVDGVGMHLSSKRAPLLGESSFPLSGKIIAGEGVELEAGIHNIALVLDRGENLDLLETLGAWALDGESEGRKLVIVGRSFASLQQQSQWQQLREREAKQFAGKVKDFEQRIEQWKNLEDYLRAKHPRPHEPQRSIEFFDGYFPLSIDYLSDRKQGLLSIERPDFRGGEDLRTHPIDRVVFESESRERNPHLHCFNIQAQERGYFTLKEFSSGQLLQEVERLFTRKEGQ